MQGFLGKLSERIYALVRIVVGFLFFCHGGQKILGLFGGTSHELNAMLYAAGIIELVGGAMVSLGLLTGWAAFICSGQMAVAYFLAHQKDALLPIQNHGELAALYAWVFLLIASRGSGIWSLDGVLRGGGSEAESA